MDDGDNVSPKTSFVLELWHVILPFWRIVARQQLLLAELVMDKTESKDDVGENLSTAVLGKDALQHRRRARPDEINFDLRKFLFKSRLHGYRVGGIHRQVGDEFAFFFGFVDQRHLGGQAR